MNTNLLNCIVITYFNFMKNKDTLLVDKSKIKSSLEIDWDLKMKELIKCIDLEFENNQNNIYLDLFKILSLINSVSDFS